MFEGNGVANGGMVVPDDADIMFLEQHLTMDGTFELLEIADGQIHIAGFERHPPHARRWHLHRLNIDPGRLARNEIQQLGQEHHLPQIAQVNPKCPIRGVRVEAQLALDGVADVAQGLTDGARQRFRARCRRHTVVGADEQRIVEQLAQAVQLLADPGLRQMQIRRGHGNAARLIDRIEHVQ